jgi:arylsulfatase A-like enzyme
MFNVDSPTTIEQRRACRRAILTCGLLLLSAGAGLAEEPAAKRPNVLFLFADDQRPDTIAALGNSHIETPNLDRLAKSGCVLRNAYCMGSDRGAVCLPSRTMMHSGLSLFHLDRATPENPHFGRSMKELGYETYHHSKRGNTPQALHKVFEHSQYLTDNQDRTSGYPGKPAADAAIEFLSTRKKDRPFFMYVGFSGPHDPRVASDEYLAKYDLAKLPLPANYLPLHPFNNGELTIRDESLAPWPRSEDEIRRHLRDYYAVITYMDYEIGRILAALRAAGEYDSTIIIYSADHGLAVGSHGLMGKQNLYEHSMGVPLIFAGPGIPAGQAEGNAYLYDIYPTTVELVGGRVPEGLDGKSLAGVLHGRQKAVRDVIFTAYKDVMRAARQGDWKIIRYPHVNRTQLFNLKDDPQETKNLADDPAHAGKLREMMALLAEQQRAYDDKQPLTSDNPEPAEVDAAELTRLKGKQR